MGRLLDPSRISLTLNPGYTCCEAKEIGPCFGFGPGDRPIPLYLPSRRTSEGVGAPTRRWARIAPGGCPDCSGRWGALAGAPRASRRANAASSAYASVSGRAAPGAVCPWRVSPEAARGTGLR